MRKVKFKNNKREQMNELTPKQYMEQWLDLSSKTNPKPPPEEIERLKKEYRAQRKRAEFEQWAMKQMEAANEQS